MELPKKVEWVLSQLHQEGYEAFLVGGCVRDSLLSKPVSDYDICTSALPEQTMACFAGKAKVVPTGLEHGTVTIVKEGKPYEITTYRVDGTYADGRHPDQVTFTPSLEEDLKRRDFTINAMAWDQETGLVDPFGGQRDLKAGIIRCVGEPQERFGEDALRILRGLRFGAMLGFSIDPATEQAMFQQKELLKKVSAERVQTELNRLLTAPHGVEMLRRYREIFEVWLPELSPMFDHPQHNPYHRYDVWEHTLHVMEATSPRLELRLAALLHDIGKPQVFWRDEKGIGHFWGHNENSFTLAQEILKRLKYDRHTRETVLTLVQYHDGTFEPDEKHTLRWLQKVGLENYHLLLQLRRADWTGQGTMPERLTFVDHLEEALSQVEQKGSCYQRQQLAVSGKDVMAYGVPQGKAVGQVLQQLLDLVTEGVIPNQRQVLLGQVERLTKQKEKHT